MLGYKEEQKENESLTVLMHLRNSLVSDWVDVEYAPRIFDAYVNNVFKNCISNTYGSNFEEERKVENENIGYTFSRDGIKIVYCASPIRSVSGSAIYNSDISLEQENIDMKNAGFFIKELLDTNILAYNGEFMISHRKGDITISKSYDLLEKLNVHPTDAASFTVAKGTVGVWMYVKLEK